MMDDILLRFRRGDEFDSKSRQKFAGDTDCVARPYTEQRGIRYQLIVSHISREYNKFFRRDARTGRRLNISRICRRARMMSQSARCDDLRPQCQHGEKIIQRLIKMRDATVSRVSANRVVRTYAIMRSLSGVRLSIYVCAARGDDAICI